MCEVQKHGFLFENQIKKICCDKEIEIKYTECHDIPKEYNILDKQYNISVKSVKEGTSVCCGDPTRLIDYEDDVKMIIIVYKQSGVIKRPTKVIEIVFNEEFKKTLFGGTSKEDIKETIDYIKKIPEGRCDEETKKTYKNMCKGLNKNGYITFNPKVDSKKQRRLQCSIKNIETLCKNNSNITYTINEDCVWNEKKITSVHSPPRKFN